MPDLSQSATSDRAMKKPWIELRRKLGVGHYRSYVMVYRKPFQLWVNGRWWVR